MDRKRNLLGPNPVVRAVVWGVWSAGPHKNNGKKWKGENKYGKVTSAFISPILAASSSQSIPAIFGPFNPID